MTSVLGILARIHRLDEAGWARHSNPLSGWTRAATLPALALVLWNRDALGPWTWALAVALFLWTLLNPRLFPPPRDRTSWMTRATFGERIWLNRKSVPVPLHYRRAVTVILAISLAGLPLLGWGLWTLNGWATLFGLTLALLGKFWFLDRMVWLHDDMREVDPMYAAWSNPPA